MAGKWKKKIKKFAKTAGKAALVAGALYGAAKLGKARGMKGNVSKTAAMEDLNIGVRPGIFPPKPKKVVPKTPPVDEGIWGSPWGGKKGGRATAKHGGRTRKQFGGGLNRPVAGPVGGVGAGVGAGVRAPVRPLAYKHGGKVKSMGIAKRGGGVAKR